MLGLNLLWFIIFVWNVFYSFNGRWDRYNCVGVAFLCCFVAVAQLICGSHENIFREHNGIVRLAKVKAATRSWASRVTAINILDTKAVRVNEVGINKAATCSHRSCVTAVKYLTRHPGDSKFDTDKGLHTRVFLAHPSFSSWLSKFLKSVAIYLAFLRFWNLISQ